MLLTIDERDSNVNHWVSSEESFLHLVMETLFNAWNVALGDGSALDYVVEGVVEASVYWSYLNEDLTILAVSTGLLLVCVLDDAGLLRNRLSVRDPWKLGVDLDLLLLLDLVKDHVEMELSHSRYRGLLRLFVVCNLECEVFFRDLMQGIVHLVFRLLVCCGYCKRVDWVREAEALERELHVCASKKRAVGGCYIALCDDSNVTGHKGIGLNEFLSNGSVDLARLFLLAQCWVEEVCVACDASCDDLEEGELSRELVYGCLEAECGCLSF